MLLIADIILPFLAVALVFLAYIIISPPNSHSRDTVTDLTNGWYGEDGTEYSLSGLPEGDIVLSRDISGIDKRNRNLCMKSDDTWIEIYYDGQPEYRYAPEQASVYGASYGYYVHIVSIPQDANELTLKLHPVYNGRVPLVSSVCIDETAVFLTRLYHQGTFSFLICLIMLGFGIIMLIMGFTSRELNEMKMLNFFALGSLSVLVALWSVNDTYLLQAYTNHPECIKMLTYISLILISYPPVSFMASATHNRKSKLLPVMISLVFLNLLLNFILAVTGTADPHDLLFISQANIGISMLMVISLMVKAIKNKSANKVFVRMTITGMTSAIIGVSTDLIRYWVNQDNDSSSSTFTQLGVLLFLFSSGASVITEGRIAS